MAGEDSSNEVLSAENWGMTLVDVIKLHYKWTITNFSACPWETGSVLRSPVFSSSDKDKTKWCLRVNPGGLDQESKDYISLYLLLVSCNKPEIKAKFKLSLIDKTFKEAKSMESHKTYTFEREKDWGFKKFIRRDFLFDEGNNLMPDDRLTIFCEVSMIIDYVHASGRINPFQYKVPECSLGDDFKELFLSQKFSDVILTADGREFLAHKSILAARSRVFAAMFEHEMEESKLNRVEIADIKEDVLNEMLLFIYTGKSNNLEEMAFHLLPAADKYDLVRLKIMCEEVLSKNLTAENAASNLILADLHNAVQLKDEILKFIVINAADIVDTTSWQYLSVSHPLLVQEAFRALAKKHSFQSEPLNKRFKLN